MSMIRRLILIMAIAFGFLVLAPVQPLQAVNLLGPACSNGGGQSAVCRDRKDSGSNPLTGNDGIILKVVNIIAIVAGAAAVIIIIISGLRFITSGGSSDDVAGARRAIIYAAIGLIVIALARVIIGFVLGRL